MDISLHTHYYHSRNILVLVACYSIEEWTGMARYYALAFIERAMVALNK